MKNFNVKVCKNDSEGITLIFFSENKVKLMIKDIKYYYRPKESDLSKCRGIIPVFLDNDVGKKIYFEYPCKGKMYSSITFLIKETKENNGYKVRLDIQTSEVEIEFADFKI